MCVLQCFLSGYLHTVLEVFLHPLYLFLRVFSHLFLGTSLKTTMRETCNSCMEFVFSVLDVALSTECHEAVLIHIRCIVVIQFNRVEVSECVELLVYKVCIIPVVYILVPYIEEVLMVISILVVH